MYNSSSNDYYSDIGNTRKRRQIGPTSSFLNSTTSSLSLVPDISYSSVKRKRASTRSGPLPPPLPSATNQFPLHSPPRTPRRIHSQRELQSSVSPIASRSYTQSIPKARGVSRYLPRGSSGSYRATIPWPRKFRFSTFPW